MEKTLLMEFNSRELCAALYFIRAKNSPYVTYSLDVFERFTNNVFSHFRCTFFDNKCDADKAFKKTVEPYI